MNLKKINKDLQKLDEIWRDFIKIRIDIFGKEKEEKCEKYTRDHFKEIREFMGLLLKVDGELKKIKKKNLPLNDDIKNIRRTLEGLYNTYKNNTRCDLYKFWDRQMNDRAIDEFERFELLIETLAEIAKNNLPPTLRGSLMSHWIKHKPLRVGILTTSDYWSERKLARDAILEVCNEIGIKVEVTIYDHREKMDLHTNPVKGNKKEVAHLSDEGLPKRMIMEDLYYWGLKKHADICLTDIPPNANNLGQIDHEIPVALIFKGVSGETLRRLIKHEFLHIIELVSVSLKRKIMDSEKYNDLTSHWLKSRYLSNEARERFREYFETLAIEENVNHFK